MRAAFIGPPQRPDICTILRQFIGVRIGGGAIREDGAGGGFFGNQHLPLVVTAVAFHSTYLILGSITAVFTLLSAFLLTVTPRQKTADACAPVTL